MQAWLWESYYRTRTSPHTPRSVQACTNSARDFLLGVLHHMVFICYRKKSLACLKFQSRKPKHLSFKKDICCWLNFLSVLIHLIFGFNSFDFLFNDTHREKSTWNKTPACEKYEYGHFGSRYIKATLLNSFLYWNKIKRKN